MTGKAEAIRRALCDIESRLGRKFKAEDIEVHANGAELNGYSSKKRAHVIIRKEKAGCMYGDLGFEQKTDGSWVCHLDNLDERAHYNANWQKRLLSKWAVEKVCLEAEDRGQRWTKRFETVGDKKYCYVSITR